MQVWQTSIQHDDLTGTSHASGVQPAISFHRFESPPKLPCQPVIDTERSRAGADQPDKEEHVQDFRGGRPIPVLLANWEPPRRASRTTRPFSVWRRERACQD